ncbi:carbon starvation CstA family protein, partial [Corallococcus exiguus]|uniref:carbon starvation CstA family protein n=2 Tax=Myxococcaceae TaxID=31 RepID=UPI00265F914A
MGGVARKLGWVALALVGAFCLGVVALHRGESISAIWLVIASVAVFMLGYRFYGRFIAEKALQVDPSRATP